MEDSAWFQLPQSSTAHGNSHPEQYGGGTFWNGVIRVRFSSAHWFICFWYFWSYDMSESSNNTYSYLTGVITDICQIWMWFSKYYQCFDNFEKKNEESSAFGKIDLVTPTPGLYLIKIGLKGSNEFLIIKVWMFSWPSLYSSIHIHFKIKVLPESHSMVLVPFFVLKYLIAWMEIKTNTYLQIFI